MSDSPPSIESIAAALNASDFARAESLASARTAALPDDLFSQALVGVSLALLKRPHDAAAVYRDLISKQPLEPSHYFNLGSTLRETADLDGAEAAYRQGLILSPDSAVGLADLGSLRWQRGDPVETRELMLKAWKINPDLPEPRIYGAPACVNCADAETAKKLLEGCENWVFLGENLEAELCASLIQIDRLDEAERRLRALLKHSDAQSIASLRLAGLLERLNRLDEADAVLADARIAEADRKEEAALRATLAARRGNYAQAIPLYIDSLSDGNDSILSAAPLFALATAYDRTNEPELAMQTLHRGHRVQVAHAGRLMPKMLDPESNPLNLVDFAFTEQWYRQWQADPHAPDVERSPIFIVGFPRSGTTLLEQMIEAHPGVRSMDERAFLQDVINHMQSAWGFNYPDDLDKLDASAVAQLRDVYWRCVERVFTLAPEQRLLDKNPLNILKLPLIHRLFPNARIILALRHPCDVLLSNYMQCFTAPAFQILCSTFERLARGYADAMECWVGHAKLFDASILNLRYEDLLNDVDTQIKRIADHLKLHDAAALHGYREHAIAKGFIATPSYSEVIQPLSKKAIGRWRRYQHYLQPILPVLEPAMDRWGYEA